MAQVTNKSKMTKTQSKEKWGQFITETLNVDTNDKLMSWLPYYCTSHMVSESANATVGNTPGMGNVALPGNPLGQYDFYSQTKGSGDKPMSYLAMSMQIAADTVALQCVPVVPADAPVTFLSYFDVLYANGKIDSTTDRPDLFLVDARFDDATQVGAIMTVTGTVSTNVELTAVYLGKSRIYGYPIFMVKSIAQGLSIGGALANATLATDIVITDGTTSSNPTFASKIPEHVRALEDHVAGFSGQLFERLRAAATPADSVVAMKYTNMPYGRGEGEATNTRSLGLRFSNKSVQAETWQVDISVTREQIDDARQHGTNVIEIANKALVNEASQSLNKNLIDRIFALGALNHKRIFDATGTHFNVNFDDTTGGILSTNFILGLDAAGNLAEIITPSAVAPAKSQTGGETITLAHRRILMQIMAAANEVERRGRLEAADTIITNNELGAVLMTMQQFNEAPVNSSIRTTVGLRNIGTLMGMQVFIDPNMSALDTRIAVFRRGNGETPGLIYMPYRIADIVSTIAENTMAPKMQLKSRGQIVEAGHHPELYYITLKVNVRPENGLLR